MRALVLAAALVVAGCGGGADEGVEGAADDVRALAEHVERVHPDPFHSLDRASFRREVDELAARAESLSPDELLVELMRLAALPGERDGHSGIFPLDTGHRRPLHLYPLRLYRFPEGFHVVAQVGGRDLVGARVLSIGGVSIREATTRLRPLVPADNEWSARARLAQWLVVAEVLHGAGIVEGRNRATFELELDGKAREVELEPVPAERWSEAFPDLFHPMIPQGLPPRPEPRYLERREEPAWAELLANGTVAYAALNVTLGEAAGLAGELEELVRRPQVERVVLDLRHNPGGNNFTYEQLLQVLQSPAVDRLSRLYVLVSRTTFSAAANLCAELDRTTEAVFVGEPSGGSPNLYGDPSPLQLPATGWNVHAATIYWEKSTPGDPRLAFEPDVPVRLTARDFFSGRDPVLERVLP